MAEDLFIPKLGQTVEEVTLINWLVQDGDKVEHGQAVLEVETDKAVFEVEATDSGIIHIGPFKAGEVIPVLTVVAIIGEKDDVFSAAPPPTAAVEEQISTPTLPEEKPTAASTATTPSQAPAAPAAAAPGKVFASPRARKLAAAEQVDLSIVTPSGGGGVRVREMDVQAYLSSGPARVSPIARRMAADAGLDLRTVRGSGPRGEITRADVEMALAKNAVPASPTPAAPKSVPLPPMEVAETLPLKGVRGVIAERMAASVHSTARVTLLMDADATDFAALREKLKAEKEVEWGFAPGYNDLLAKACGCALRRFPYMNARLNGDVIERLARVNIGIAVDAERGLYVPVLRDVDQKDLRTLGSELRQRVDEIRANKILPEHLSGSTFTITNLGAYDVDGFTPVINIPEAAILGVGRIAPRAVVVDGQITARRMLTLSLVFDHRLVDGAPAAQFLKYLKELIEKPNEVMLTL